MPFTVSDAERSELSVVYATLILNDDKAPITEDNINKLLDAASVEVEPYWPKLFADLLQGRNVSELLLNAGGAPGAGGGGAGPAAGGAAPAAAAGAAKEAEKAKKEESSESEADMGFSLFD